MDPTIFPVFRIWALLGGLVGSLGQEVPHKGPKGTKMNQHVQKIPNINPKFLKEIMNAGLQKYNQNLSCSPSAPKAPGAGRGGLLPKAAQSAAPVRLGLRKACQISWIRQSLHQGACPLTPNLLPGGYRRANVIDPKSIPKSA